MLEAVKDTIANSFVRIRGWNARERALMRCDTLAGIREYVRGEIDEARPAAPSQSDQFASHPATYDEIVDDLSIAASRRQQFGATRAQIETIARLAVRDRLTLDRISCSTLTKAEASAIISTF